jgi:hypothetical protein
MASAYRPWSPSTGPGFFNGNIPQYNTFQANGIGTPNGTGFNSNLGPNNTPNPGPPASPTEAGILLEPSLNEFIALEVGSGGPAFHLQVE